MIRSGRRAAIALGLALAMGPIAAGERTHVVQQGESAASIAKRYYGDHELADLLLRYNGKRGTMIHPGEKLNIPFSEVHRVRRGDSWSALAERYLERAGRFPALASLNDTVPERPLRIGEQLVMPVVLTHTLAGGETLSVLADRFYGSAAKQEILQAFNRIDDPRRLSVGQSIEIPLIAFRLKAATAPPPKATPPKASPPKPSSPIASQASEPGKKSFESPLRSAALAYREGDYAEARKALEALRAPVLDQGSDAEQAELWRLLTFTYVAFDLEPEACGAYASLRTAAGVGKLDPRLVSPKIRRVVANCTSPG